MDLKRSKQRARAGESGPFSAEESLDELRTLAESASAIVQDAILQQRAAPDAATLVGSGKVEEIRDRIRFHEADLVVFDADLTPTQQRNLEKALDAKVIDRTQLILDIFARRARTREGQLQVELAQLEYRLPRLTGRGIEMSRLGGGIGTRGPGETQLETDRRRIHRRIRAIEDDLDAVRSSRGVQRTQRQAVPLATVALVGYTNAGKSTLFNRLTNAGVLADAKMFATLDPTVRHIMLPSKRRVLLSDTVGFIRNLPTTLVKAFRATLEEVTEASLLLHVVDAASPHTKQHAAQVTAVLNEIGAAGTRHILVLNKTDLLADALADAASFGRGILGETAPATRAVAVSARQGTGLRELTDAIDAELDLDPVSHARFRIPAGEGALIHLLHEGARVTAGRYADEFWEAEAEVPESILRQLKQFRVE